MKRLLIFCAFLLLSLLAVAGAQDKPAPAAAPATCGQLAAKLDGGDPNIDYDLLRSLCADGTAGAQLGDVDEQPQMKSLYALLSDKKYAEALKAAEAILSKDPINYEARLAAHMGATRSGATDRASFHNKVLFSLLQSVTQGRDGRSAEKCWNAVVIHEEYVALQFGGYAVRKQSLFHSPDGHNYDVMTVTSEKETAPFQVFFNIDTMWEREQKALGGKTK